MENLIQATNENTKLFSLEGYSTFCKVVDIYDADTCKLVFFLPNNNTEIVKMSARLTGIDAPEIRPSKSSEYYEEEKKAAKIARNRFVQLATNCNIPDVKIQYKKKEIKKIISENTKLVYCIFDKFDKYGRVLVSLSDDKDSETYNNMLIEEGYGYEYFGGTKEEYKKS